MFGIIVIASILGLITILFPLIRTRNKTSKVIRERSSNSLIDLNKLIITISSAIIALTVNLKLNNSILVDFKAVWFSFLFCIILGILSYFLDYVRKLYDELFIHSAEELFNDEKNDKVKLKREFDSNANRQAVFQTIVYVLIYLEFVAFVSGMIITISKGLDL